MDAQCARFGSKGERTADGGCCTLPKLGYCVLVAVALAIAILSPTITYVVYNEAGVDDAAQQLLQVRQAEESNYLLQIRGLEDTVRVKQEAEQRLAASLRAQLERSKVEQRALETKCDGQVESLQEKYDKQLSALQVKLNVQIEQNRVHYAQIVQLHGDHLREIVAMLDEFKEAQAAFNDVESYVKKSREKLQHRWEALNKEKDKITITLKKLNATATPFDALFKKN